MSRTIAIVGAGPGVGLAVAEKFGRQGYKTALIARSKDKCEKLLGRLASKGIESVAVQADILDREKLANALGQVKEKFGSIDVLEFSPLPSLRSLQSPRDIDVENVRYLLDLHVLGAITAVREVLPDMLAKRSGSLLFTSVPSAERPIVAAASIGVGTAGLLNYVRGLHEDLATDGIYAGIAIVAGIIVPSGQGEAREGDRGPLAFPFVAAEDVAAVHWKLHSERGECKATIGDVEKLYATSASEWIPARPSD